MTSANAEPATRQSNAEILAGAYGALAAGDVPTVLAALSESITWQISGRSPLSGRYCGIDEVVGFFQAIGERSNGTFRLEIHEILAGSADTVVALVTERAERGDAELADAAVHVWRFDAGRAVAFQAFTADEHAQDAFWS